LHHGSCATQHRTAHHSTPQSSKIDEHQQLTLQVAHCDLATFPHGQQNRTTKDPDMLLLLLLQLSNLDGTLPEDGAACT
jgi:hypothetical protein